MESSAHIGKIVLTCNRQPPVGLPDHPWRIAVTTQAAQIAAADAAMPLARVPRAGAATARHQRDILALMCPVSLLKEGVQRPAACWRSAELAFDEDAARRGVGICAVTEDRRLRVLHVAMAAAVAVASLASPARAVEAINVRVDIAAIDLTDVVERLQTDSDRIQVSTAPGNDGIVRRVEVRAREAGVQLGGVRARQFQRRADRPADRGAALSDGRLEDPVARSRPVPHRQHHAELGRPAGPRRQRHRRHLPHHPRSRRRHHLRRRAAHQRSCRRSICGSPTPTRTRSTASRSTTASSSASPACSRCS